jgi:hypothetical protein
MHVATVSELSENERTVLKCLLGLNRDEAGILTFASSTVGKQLGLGQEEVESIIDRLVSKGYFTLLRAPSTSVPVRHIIDGLNELDYAFLVGYVNPDHYAARRDRLIRKLSDYAVPDEFLRELSVSPKLANEAYQRQRECLEKLDKMRGLNEIDQNASAVRTLVDEYTKGINDARNILDLFRGRAASISRDLSSRGEKTENSLHELQIRFKLEEMSEEEFKDKETSLKDQLEELHLIRCALCGIIARGESLPDPPHDLKEQLELIDARRVIGELDEKTYAQSRSKVVAEIKKSRKPDKEFTNTLVQLSPSPALLDSLKKLQRARLLSAKDCNRLRKAVRNDLSAVQALLGKDSARKR